MSAEPLPVETVLDMARRHVREGTDRVAEQTELVAQLTRDGHDTVLADEMLVTFRAALAIMVDDLQRIEADDASRSLR